MFTLLGSMVIGAPLLAANNVTLTMPYIVIATLVGLVCFLGIQLALKKKEEVDVFQESAGRAGAVAQATGFKHLDDLLYAVAGGSLRRVKNVVRFLFKEYCSTEDGPKKLARDVVVNCYAHIRDDAKYGNEVREAVVSAALGFSPTDQKRDLDFARAAGRLEKAGWVKAAKAGYALGAKDYRAMTTSIVSLCEEVLEDHGEKELAVRVARPTIEVCYNDPVYRDKIMPLLREYVAKDDARIAAEEAKAVEKAKAILAAQQSASGAKAGSAA